MSETSRRPDLRIFMEAYALLEVEYSVDPLTIRKAYRRLARFHHPDRHAAGSLGQQQATERMRALNKAYELVRDAPLSHHRVSTGSDPDRPWDKSELDEALPLARLDRFISFALGLALILGGGLFMQLILPALYGDVPAGFVSFAWIAVAVLYVLVARLPAYGYVWRVLALISLLIGIRGHMR
jgi:preprotein translocase subunit Sec63